MVARKREYFENSYESDALASWLVITAGSGLKILGYQVEMIARNNIEYILPFHVRQVNDKINFYYNITSKLSLFQFLKRKKIGMNEFTDILLGICRAILESRNYLLNDKCFLVDENMIYINPSTLEISMPYIPAAYDSDINLVLKDFILNLILHLVDFEGDRDDNRLQKILYLLKSDTFNAAALRDLLNETAAARGVYMSEANPAAPAPLNQSSQKKEKISGNTNLNRCTKKNRQNIKPLIAAVFLQVVFAAVIIFSRGFIKLKGQDTTVTYIAIALIIAAFDVLLLKKIAGKGGLAINKKNESEEKNIENTKEQPKKDAQEKPEPDILCKLDKKVNETVFLASQDDAYPFFSNGKPDEKIIIYEADFIIGRLEGHVDHVLANKAVGKVHARIISRDGLFFLIDLNSKNGTFVNGERISSNKEHEIKGGDRVSFANSHYIFTASAGVSGGRLNEPSLL